MSHLKETLIPLMMYRWRDGYYKTDAEAVEAILEAVRESLPKEKNPKDCACPSYGYCGCSVEDWNLCLTQIKEGLK